MRPLAADRRRILLDETEGKERDLIRLAPHPTTTTTRLATGATPGEGARETLVRAVAADEGTPSDRHLPLHHPRPEEATSSTLRDTPGTH